jgi:hypothetical protein
MATVKLYKDRPVNTSITANPGKVVINSKLPFRIRFTAIRIESTGSNAVVPIPLQVIGYSNYIL